MTLAICPLAIAYRGVQTLNKLEGSMASSGVIPEWNDSKNVIITLRIPRMAKVVRGYHCLGYPKFEISDNQKTFLPSFMISSI